MKEVVWIRWLTGLATVFLAAVLAATALVTISPAGAAMAYVADPASLVNPFIGTANPDGTALNPFVGNDNAGNTFPGADVPFGMVQWSPDTPTRPQGGGYNYNDHSIIGYSLTHLSGVGCPGEGDLPILPIAGGVPANPEIATAPLRHNREQAHPGYYSLAAGGVRTQLTTTLRSGMARFTFSRSSSRGTLLLKLTDSETPVTASHLRFVSPTELAGSVTTGYFCGNVDNLYTLYFDMVFNRPFAASGRWSMGGKGGYVTFDTSVDPNVEAKVGISYVSVANARLNRSVEDPSWHFEAVRRAAGQAWDLLLKRVQVAGGTPTERVIFYTALYHSALAPNVFSDVNGQYMGYDRKVEELGPGQNAEYANFSEWDIYRSEIPLLAVLVPKRVNAMVDSMLNDYTQTGQLPKWTEDGTETYSMVGDPADNIIADAYAFDVRGFNVAQALAAMQAQAEVPNDIRPGLQYYEDEGYLPIDGTYGCCAFYAPISTQEEYETDDNSIAEFASALGQHSIAKTFARRAQNWQNLFDPASGFLQPKLLDGAFQPGFGPDSQNGYAETDAYVSTTMLPFDIRGLIDAEGGPSRWIEYLNELTSSVTADATDQIQMGDEPSFGVPWLYDYVGTPFRTQEVVREVEDQVYRDSPTGLAGNDDLGELSSWYVWAALGAYPADPGSPEVVLGSPLFRAVAIHLAGGRTFTETAPAASDDTPYVSRLRVDGSLWRRTYLPVSILTGGGSLRWSLATSPSIAWGSTLKDAPASNTDALLPALGYVSGTNGEVVVDPGSTFTISLGVQSLSRETQHLRWHASAEVASSVIPMPSAGTLAVDGEKRSAVSVELEIPPGASPGTSTITFTLRTAGGQLLPDVVTEVDVR